MKQKKTLYVRTVIRDLIEKKRAVVICVLLFAAAFSAIGIQQGKKAVVLSEEQQLKVDAYKEKLYDYDNVIADTEKCLAESDKQVDEYQTYVDESIYMNIDPQNIQTATVQYGVKTEGNVGNICNSFISFINDGGMKEGLSEKYPELQVEYWREIISSYQSANTLIVTVIHYDSEKAGRILEIVKDRIEAYSSVVQSLQGEFTLVEMDTSLYVKSDINVANVQNGNRTNLKNYISNRSDFINKLSSNKAGKAMYIEENEPEVLAAQPGGHAQVIKYMLAGILFGIVVPCMWFVLRFILSDRLRSKEELSESGLNVIGAYSGDNMEKAKIERACMDIQALAEVANVKTVFLNLLHEDDISQKTANDYQRILEKLDFRIDLGSNVYESAKQLKKMIAQKSCILIVEAGKTTFSQLEQQQELCRLFHVPILGGIVIE